MVAYQKRHITIWNICFGTIKLIFQKVHLRDDRADQGHSGKGVLLALRKALMRKTERGLSRPVLTTEGGNEEGGDGGDGATAAGVGPAAGALLLATSGTSGFPII